LQAIRVGQHEMNAQDERVQAQQLVVQQTQARHDNLGKMAREARWEVAREHALKEALEVEDLYVATLYRSRSLA
jgi:hypothetical protein